MKNKELSYPDDIETRFHKLRLPTLNMLDLPLSGLYNSLDNIESSDFFLSDKFDNFDITPNNGPNIQNLLLFNDSNFREIFLNEIFEGLLIIINKANYDVVIKNIIIKNVAIDNELNEEEQPIDAQIPDNPVIINPKKIFSLKVIVKVNHIGMNKIFISFTKKSEAYDIDYIKKKQKFKVKEKTDSYEIKNVSPEFYYLKKVKFESLNPFKITQKFHFFQNDKCLIEIKIKNNTNLFPITLLDVFLTPKSNKDVKIPLVNNLEEIKGNKYGQSENDTKYITLELDEEIFVLFKIDNSEKFYDEKKFILNIEWLKICDFNNKLYTYEFNNNLKLCNKYFQLIITEKPADDIILNNEYTIKFKIISRNLENKYTIKIHKIIDYSNNKINDKKLDIIGISERNITLDNKTPSSEFSLTCNSKNVGIVHLAKFKLSLFEDNKNYPIDYYYEDLFSFNCISEIPNDIIKK